MAVAEERFRKTDLSGPNDERIETGLENDSSWGDNNRDETGGREEEVLEGIKRDQREAARVLADLTERDPGMFGRRYTDRLVRDRAVSETKDNVVPIKKNEEPELHGPNINVGVDQQRYHEAVQGALRTRRQAVEMGNQKQGGVRGFFKRIAGGLEKFFLGSRTEKMTNGLWNDLGPELNKYIEGRYHAPLTTDYLLRHVANVFEGEDPGKLVAISEALYKKTEAKRAKREKLSKKEIGFLVRSAFGRD